MKGLITKEFLYLRRQGRSLLILVVFFVVFFLIMAASGEKGNDLCEAVSGILIAVPVMLTILLVINATAYDERANWDVYVLSLPVSRDRIVAARYLSVALLSLAGAALSFVIGLLLLPSRQDLPVLVAAAFACPILICSFLFPLFFRFGLQKARFAIAGIFLLWFAVQFLLDHSGMALGEAQQELFWKLSPVFALAIIAISFLISCAVYRRKQI